VQGKWKGRGEQRRVEVRRAGRRREEESRGAKSGVEKDGGRR
jgi:hypothetical protein